MTELLTEYLKILKLKSTCTKDDIKKSYRILAQKYHPDKNLNGKDTSKQFIQVKKAYDFLILNFNELSKFKTIKEIKPRYQNFNVLNICLNVSIFESFQPSFVYCKELKCHIKIPTVFHNQLLYLEVLDNFNNLRKCNFNIQLYDPNNFYKIITRNNKTFLYAEVKVSYAQLLSKSKLFFKNVNKNIENFEVVIDTDKEKIIDHFGLLTEKGSRGPLIVKFIPEFKSLDKELYHILFDLNKITNELIKNYKTVLN